MYEPIKYFLFLDLIGSSRLWKIESHLNDTFLTHLDVLCDIIETGTGPAGTGISSVDAVDSDNLVQTLLGSSLELGDQLFTLSHEGQVELGQI